MGVLWSNVGVNGSLFLQIALPQKPPWWTVFEVSFEDIEVVCNYLLLTSANSSARMLWFLSLLFDLVLVCFL